MVDAEETKRRKARELRYRKPIVKNLNIETITQEIWEIQEECENVHWYFDTDEDTLINALDGDEDEAYEFKMMFGDLCAECEKMLEDLANEYIPEYFNSFFVAIEAGDFGGGYLGYDSYEQDYFGLQCSDSYAEQEAGKKLKQLTKEQLIQGAHMCFKVYHSYIGLRHRYDCLKASMDILRDQNTGHLQLVKQIEEVYEKANDDRFYEYHQPTRDLIRFANNLPPEAWIA
ncbi:hypothetical protein AALB39_27420 [Lachnospiraceae bacterium 54-53]